MQADEIPAACQNITAETGLPAFDVLANGPDGLVALLKSLV